MVCVMSPKAPHCCRITTASILCPVTALLRATCLHIAPSILGTVYLGKSHIIVTYVCVRSAATLEYSPGSAVAIFVTYLQPKLLQRMHETEGAYNLCKLTEVQLQVGLGLQDYR